MLNENYFITSEYTSYDRYVNGPVALTTVSNPTV